jgi:nitrate/TMAO reductase-like tetraheme cytochrome c subunit
MTFWALASGAVVAVALLLMLRASVRSPGERRAGALAFVAMLVVPGVWFLGMLAYADGAMRSVSFCVRCHEMRPYAEDLLMGEESLAAAHFREDHVDRDRACYDCHTRPGFSGFVEAKLTGLHDLRVHYFGDVPEELSLGRDYPMSICLKCHAVEGLKDDAVHRPVAGDLVSGAIACLDCHGVVHDRTD